MPIGPVHSSPHIRFSGMQHSATRGTPDGPATRRINATAMHFGNLSHWALVRDGVNKYKEYYGIRPGKPKDRSSKLIEVINNDTHEVLSTIRVKRNSMVYVVNFETGNIIDLENPTNKQSYISRFNKDTFPKQVAYEIDITEVGFWTVFGNYWPPVKFNEDHFSKRELDREVGVLKEKQEKEPFQEQGQGTSENPEEEKIAPEAKIEKTDPLPNPDPVRASVMRSTTLQAPPELRQKPSEREAPKPVPIDPFRAQMGSQFRLRDGAASSPQLPSEPQ